MNGIALNFQSSPATWRSPIRYALGGLLAFGALCAFAGGYYGLAGAEDVPREWLEGTPFSDYFIPSLILFAGIGGSYLLASVVVFAGLRIARLAAFAAGVILLAWLAVELVLIGYVSWMQPATTVGALVVLGLAWLLPTGPRTHVTRIERVGAGYAWFGAMVGGWIGFYVLMATSEPTLADLHNSVRGLPTALEALVWLALFPFVLALTIWDSSWSEWVRFALVACCAVGWSIAFYPWRKSGRPQPEEVMHVQ